MSMDSKFTEPQPGSEWIVGGGDMGGLIRSMDWSRTALGPIASWPQSLRTAINLCLASDLPICIIWGPDLVQLYNDGYRVICGDKHPRAMGQKFPECWSEAWPVIGAAHESALAGDTAFLEDQQILPVIRANERRRLVLTARLRRAGQMADNPRTRDELGQIWLAFIRHRVPRRF